MRCRVSRKTAEALNEIGFNTYDKIVFYFGETLCFNLDVENLDIECGRKAYIPNKRVVNLSAEELRSSRIVVAPTIHEALDWFEIKGEVYRVSPTLIDDRVEYISEVMDEGAFITIGKQEERWEAEALIMNYYLNIYLDNKINRLKRYKNEN